MDNEQENKNFLSKVQDVINIGIGIFLGLLCMGILILILSFTNVLHLSQLLSLSNNSQSLSPSHAVTPSLEKCTITKEHNPLIGDLHTEGTTVNGYFKGKLTNITYTQSNTIALLRLSSLDNKQTQIFNIEEEKLKLSHISSFPMKITPDLSIGQIALITFTCLPQGGNQFIITGISGFSK